MRVLPSRWECDATPRRFFPPEYKAEVVELIRSTGKTVGRVARELDLTETAVREWVKRADLDAGRRTDGLTTAEREELRKLRREVRDLREERRSCARPRFSSPGRPIAGGTAPRAATRRRHQLPILSSATSRHPDRTGSGWPTSPSSAPARVGCTWQ
jgi:transposase